MKTANGHIKVFWDCPECGQDNVNDDIYCDREDICIGCEETIYLKAF